MGRMEGNHSENVTFIGIIPPCLVGFPTIFSQAPKTLRCNQTKLMIKHFFLSANAQTVARKNVNELSENSIKSSCIFVLWERICHLLFRGRKNLAYSVLLEIYGRGLRRGEREEAAGNFNKMTFCIFTNLPPLAMPFSKTSCHTTLFSFWSFQKVQFEIVP